MESIIFIVCLIIYGIWIKHVNTKYMRKLANECFEKHMFKSNPPIPLYGGKNPLPLLKKRIK